jgi:hypothetical protein
VHAAPGVCIMETHPCADVATVTHCSCYDRWRCRQRCRRKLSLCTSASSTPRQHQTGTLHLLSRQCLANQGELDTQMRFTWSSCGHHKRCNRLVPHTIKGACILHQSMPSDPVLQREVHRKEAGHLHARMDIAGLHQYMSLRTCVQSLIQCGTLCFCADCRQFLAVLDAMRSAMRRPGMVGVGGMGTSTAYPLPAIPSGDVRIIRWCTYL